MRPDDFAIFSGTPHFAHKIHVGRPNLVDRERLMQRIGEVLDRHWFTNNGPMVQEFEERLARLAGVKHCIATSNATVGLELATRALGFKGEAVVPSFTFIATAHALQWQGITPIFCDIDPLTHTIDPVSLEAAITPATTGIVGVHLWGRPCAVDRLEAIARERGLKLVFDAAHAFGCTFRGKPIGGFGDAEVFSFHATKFANSFEGGAIATNDDALAAKIRLMKNFGFAGYDNVVAVGTNGKMTEVCAAMGLTSLESMDVLVQLNRENYGRYEAGLRGLKGLHLTPYAEEERSNYQYVIAEVDERAAGLSRDQLHQVLWAENVLARRYFFPGCHRSEPYRATWAGRSLPATEALADRVLALPTGSGVNAAEIQAICELIAAALENAPALRRKLNP